MTLIELLATGLEKGRRYIVTLAPPAPGDEPLVRELCFAGFRFYYDHKTAEDADDIIPVFNEPTASGKMSTRHFRAYPTDVRYIISIRPAEENIPSQPLGRHELYGASSAIRALEHRYLEQLRRLLTEMDDLFPGRRIAFDPDVRPCAVRYFEHGCESCDIMYVRYDRNRKGLLYDIQTEIDAEHDVPAIGFDASYYGDLLSETVNAIRDPWFGDEDDEGVTFIDRGTSWKDIPKADPERHPILTEARCLEDLREYLWFRSLTTEEKRKVFKDEVFKTDDMDDARMDYLFLYELQPSARRVLFRQNTKED